MFPQKEMGGGTGLKYAASTIIYLSKSKERDSKKEVVGNIIKCEAKKSRSNQWRVVKLQHVYFLTSEVLTNTTDYWNWVNSTEYSNARGIGFVIGESSVYPSAILADPEKYFTPEVMEKLEEAAQKEFSYGN